MTNLSFGMVCAFVRDVKEYRKQENKLRRMKTYDLKRAEQAKIVSESGLDLDFRANQLLSEIEARINEGQTSFEF